MKDTPYKITGEHRYALGRIKTEFCDNIILPISPNKKKLFHKWMLKKGFEAVILQQVEPVYFASRNTTSTEQSYHNLECECIAIVWGVEKFHTISYVTIAFYKDIWFLFLRKT